MNKLKNKNGITLVALIITIIVLIILAGVTISIALRENGIFRKSKKAVDEYQKSAKEEEEQLDTFYDNLESLDPNSLAAHVKLGDYVDYNPREGVGNKELKVVVEKGSYDDSKGGGYYYNWDTINKEGNPTADGEVGSGYNEEQIFTVPTEATELNKIKWRVLSIEDGCVNLISETEIGRNGQWQGDGSDGLGLEDITGYAYGPQILDEICNLYGQGRGAKKGRSITVEDVNKLSGYDPMEDEEFQDKYGQEIPLTVEDINKTYIWRDSFYVYDFNKSGMSLRTENKDDLAYQLMMKDNNNFGGYWLASRFVKTDNIETGFGMYLIDYDDIEYDDDDTIAGVSHCYFLSCINSYSTNYGDGIYRIRPVVSLKSTAKFDADSGNGTAENPIKFAITEEE